MVLVLIGDDLRPWARRFVEVPLLISSIEDIERYLYRRKEV